MKNLLLDTIEYKTEDTRWGKWRRFLYPTGARFSEFTSHSRMLGLPLVHYASGINPATGKRIVAKGIIAVGRLAVGVFAIGHASAGVIAVGQLGLGLVIGLGQLSTGAYALGQVAAAVMVGIGQVATGEVAVAQVGAGEYVLAQIGIGEYVWSTERADPEAVEFFKDLWADIVTWWQDSVATR